MTSKRKHVMEQLMELLTIYERPVTAAELAQRLEVPVEQVAGRLKTLKNEGIVQEARLEKLMEEWK
jgi:predicted ArsR family transcriptional regulator